MKKKTKGQKFCRIVPLIKVKYYNRKVIIFELVRHLLLSMHILQTTHTVELLFNVHNIKIVHMKF